MPLPALFHDRAGRPLTSRDITTALRNVGAADGRILVLHTGAALGTPNPDLSRADILRGLLDAVLALGVPTLVMPAFTFSFCENRPYHRQNTRTKMGALNEYFRRQPGVERSLDPILSWVAAGAETALVRDVGRHSIGAGSTFDRLRLRGPDVRFAFLGAFAADCFTYLHYVEERLRVPYRHDLPFTGSITDGDRTWTDTHTLFVRYHGVRAFQGPKFQDHLLQSGILRQQPAGDHFASSMPEPPAYAAVEEKIRGDLNYFLEKPLPPGPLDPSYVVDGEVLAL